MTIGGLDSPRLGILQLLINRGLLHAKADKRSFCQFLLNKRKIKARNAINC